MDDLSRCAAVVTCSNSAPPSVFVGASSLGSVEAQIRRRTFTAKPRTALLRRPHLRRHRHRQDPRHPRHQRTRSTQPRPSPVAAPFVFPAGTYLCFSIHLRSRVHLYAFAGRHHPRAIPDPSPRPGETTGFNGGAYDARRIERALGSLPGLRPQPLAQLPALGREPQRTSPSPAPASSMAAASAMAAVITIRSRIRSSAEQPGVANKAVALKNCRQHPSARPPHPQGRPLRSAAHRRRQPHDRQSTHRHRSRRHGSRPLLPQQPASRTAPSTRPGTTASALSPPSP